MRQILSGTVVALALLVFSGAASAQHNSGHSYGGGHYSHPYVQPQHSQYGYAPHQHLQRPNYGGSFSYSTPSFGLGISYGQGYDSYNYQPRYVPNHHQGQPIPSWHGQHHYLHHQYGHR
jgi:hypothetical protein